MRGRGEIAFLCEIAQPHVGLVTNVAAAHLGRLGSLQEVARAKGEIFAGLAAGGMAVLPADEPLLEARGRATCPRRASGVSAGWGQPRPHVSRATRCASWSTCPPGRAAR